MAVDKRIFIAAFLITILIFISILFSNYLLDNKREDIVTERMDSFIEQYEEIQTLLLMSEFFGEDATCDALGSALSNMNKDVWELGIKIDSYRQATEDFMNDPFYLEQKKRFNRKEVLYFTMFKKMNEMCQTNQHIISYFYKRKENCPDCDTQSFVIADIKRSNEGLAIFSFDADLDLAPINILIKSYNVTSYPCLVINGKASCRLHNKDELLGRIENRGK